jgi:hypothetical protein
MSGSPVAAAFAAGVAAQMLARNPELTSRAISQIIRTTAIPLPGADYGWHDDAGFGVIDAAGCLSRVESRRR